MKFFLLAFLVLSSFTFQAQNPNNNIKEIAYNVEIECCEFVIIGGDPNNFVSLNDFMVDGVQVLYRGIQIDLNKFNSLQAILNRVVFDQPIETYEPWQLIGSRKICLNGYFTLHERLKLSFGDELLLEDNTIIKIINGTTDDTGFFINQGGVSIKGSGGDEMGILEFENQIGKGIHIFSSLEQNANQNLITGLTLKTNIPPAGQGPGYPNDPYHPYSQCCFKDNAAIFLENIPDNTCQEDPIIERIVYATDNLSQSYFNILEDLVIEGFPNAIRLSGQANGNMINNIRMSNIFNYGVWLSGCVDNMVKDVDLRDSPTCTAAIRMDSYLSIIADCNNIPFDGSQCYLNRPVNNSFWNFTYHGCFPIIEIEECQHGSICDVYFENKHITGEPDDIPYAIPVFNMIGYRSNGIPVSCTPGYLDPLIRGRVPGDILTNFDDYRNELVVLPPNLEDPIICID